MRLLTALFVLVLLGIAARPASASPGCYYPNGDYAMNCTSPGTMPPGWKPPPEVRARWLAERPQEPETRVLLGTLLGLAAFFALIALMPRFDGSRDEDWSQDQS